MAARRANGTLPRFLDEHVYTSATDDCLLWPFGQRPYPTIYRDGRTRNVHVVVCEHTHGPRPPGLEASHTCGNGRCVNPRHLVWEAPKPNHARRVEHGTAPRGARNPAAKLTAADVAVIRQRVAAGEKQAVIAREFGVIPATVNHIIKGRNWSWL